MKRTILSIAFVVGIALITVAFSSKKVEPKNKALKSMDIQSFHFVKFQHERSRDSNSQLEHIVYSAEDGLLRFYDEWQGYHPGPGGGKQPDTQYFMTEEALTKVFNFIKENSLDKNEDNPNLKTPTDSPTDRSMERFENRSYGASFSFEMKSGKKFTHTYEYSTGGPRDKEKDAHPFHQKLVNLQKLLEKLRYGGLDGVKALEHRQKTQEEVENEMHERSYGHYIGEKPKVLERFSFSKKDEEFGAKRSKYSSSNYVYPVYALDFQFNKIRVTYYSQGGAKDSSDAFYGELPDSTIQKMLALFIEHNFYGKEVNTHYFGAKDLKPGARKITYEMQLHFGPRWMRRTEYKITYYKDLELDNPTKENKAMIANAEALETALLKLVESDEVQSLKEKK